MPEDNGVVTRPLVCVAAILVVVAVCAGCAATGGPEAETAGTATAARSASTTEPESMGEREKEEVRERELAAEGEALDSALRRALDHEGRWDELHLLVECADDGFLTTAEVFGNGVTLWNHQRQSMLDHEDLVGLLETLRDADFPRMRDLYGKEDEEEVPVPSDPPAAALRVICRVVVTLDGTTKQSAQRARGPQSDELKGLAWELLDRVRPAEGEGVTADDLDDGLAKIADGRMAPEALSLVFHRKPELGGRGPQASMVELSGFLLRLDGRRLSVEEFHPAGGYGEPRTRELEGEELSELVARLADNRVGELPDNLWAEDYTDLVIEVLDRSVRVQARQFARMTRTTHGESQVRFDRIAAELEEMAREILGVE